MLLDILTTDICFVFTNLSVTFTLNISDIEKIINFCHWHFDLSNFGLNCECQTKLSGRLWLPPGGSIHKIHQQSTCLVKYLQSTTTNHQFGEILKTTPTNHLFGEIFIEFTISFSNWWNNYRIQQRSANLVNCSAGNLSNELLFAVKSQHQPLVIVYFHLINWMDLK